VTRRSAEAAVVEAAEAALFARLKSGTAAGAVAVAVFVSMVPGGVLAGNVPVTLKVALVPGPSWTAVDSGPVPDGAHTAPGVATQDQLTPLSAGDVPESLTAAPFAVLGPLFPTTTW
jgi:hypothetical protein